MNVLPLVLTLLMMFSIVTYARLTIFLDRSQVLSKYELYMKELEHQDMNLKQERLYDKKVKSIKNDTNKEKNEDKDKSVETNEKSEDGADRHLNIIYLIKKDLKGSNQSDFTPTSKHILKELIYILYRDHPFFKELEEKNPNFVDQLIQALSDYAEMEDRGFKFERLKDLANVRLHNPDLQEFLGIILKGAPPTSEAYDRELSEKELAERDQMNYQPLSNFVILSKSKSKRKLRIYLAPRPVLMAIFKNEKDVNEIIEVRKKLFNALKSGKIGVDNDVATKEFKALFEDRIPKNLDPTFFDFRVTQTKP